MFDENSMRKQVNDYVWSQPISKRFDYKTMVTVLGIDQAYFNKHRQYFYNLVSDARLNYENRQGLKSLNFHNFRGFIKTEGMCLDREQAVKKLIGRRGIQ